MESTIRIYVACLASYNNGMLHGRWIDADQREDEIQEEVNAMLQSSPYPNVEVTCPNCDGDEAYGSLPGDVCDTCKGHGKVPSAEEWAIHNFEGFEGIKLEEYTPLATVAALATLIESDGEAFAAWYNNESRDSSDDVDTLRDAFQEAYRGTFRDVEAYAYDYIESTGSLNGVPEFVSRYFDYEAFARDMELGGDIWTAPGGDGVFVFDNNV